MKQTLSLHRDAFGRLAFIAEDGTRHVGVVPVRAFPVSAADEGVALMSADGHELAWLDRLADLDEPARSLLESELHSREFMPEIRRLKSVSSFATPSVWSVETDRGPTEFTLKGEEDIRRLAGSTLLIADAHGVQYLLRDLARLDRHSRKLLDRFL